MQYGLNMFPKPPINNSLNGCLTHSKIRSQFSSCEFVRDIHRSYFFYKVFGKLSVWMIFPLALAIFINAIFSVFCLSSYKKMFWICAYFVVALVTDTHSFWNRAIMKFPRKSVSFNIVFRPFHSGISLLPKITIPSPAIRAFYNIFKESTFWSSFRLFKTRPTSFGTFRMCNYSVTIDTFVHMYGKYTTGVLEFQ